MTSFLATGTFCGFIIILVATFASLLKKILVFHMFYDETNLCCCISGYLVKSKINKRIDIFYSLIGAILFLASGVFITEEWQHAFRTRTRDTALLKGALSIVNGVLFIFDCIFTFKGT